MAIISFFYCKIRLHYIYLTISYYFFRHDEKIKCHGKIVFDDPLFLSIESYLKLKKDLVLRRIIRNKDVSSIFVRVWNLIDARNHQILYTKGIFLKRLVSLDDSNNIEETLAHLPLASSSFNMKHRNCSVYAILFYTYY